MPARQGDPLRRLSRTERAALQRIARSTSERVDQVRRASALLAVARAGVFLEAAREAGLGSGKTVSDLVARFNRHGLAAGRIARRRGRRPTYTARGGGPAAGHSPAWPVLAPGGEAACSAVCVQPGGQGQTPDPVSPRQRPGECYRTDQRAEGGPAPGAKDRPLEGSG